MSQSTVSRIWRAFGLKPWRVDSFKLSEDPMFIEKVREIVGLYLNPPERARSCCASTRSPRCKRSTALSRSCRCGRPRLSATLMTTSFRAQAADVCGLYLDPPDNAVVYSIDEKSGMQAKSRKNPTKPALPGTPTRREFEYKRHGTAVLYAALEVHGGGLDGGSPTRPGPTTSSAFSPIVSKTPRGLELHCICDNLSAHSTTAVEDFLDEHPHVFLHNTPTHASWLNQVELFLSILSRRLLRHGEFSSVDDMTERILAFIDHYNITAKPFRWTNDGRPLQVA